MESEVFTFTKDGFKRLSEHPELPKGTIVYAFGAFMEESYCLTGCWCDSAIDNALNNIKQSVKNKFNAREFVNSILEGFFEQWRNDYEYAISDECISEEIEANDYEFYENGKPYTD